MSGSAGEAQTDRGPRAGITGTAFLTRNDLFADLSRGPDLHPIATRVAGDPPRGLPDDLGMLLLFGLCVALLRRRRYPRA